MKNITVTFLLFLINHFAYAQAFDSVISKKVIRDKKYINRDLVYYKGHVTQELYTDSLGKRIQSIYYYNSGKKQRESFNNTDNYSISIEYYKSGKRKAIDSSTTYGHWFKSYFRNGRQKQNNFNSSGTETLAIDSNTSIIRSYNGRWKLKEENFYKKGVQLSHKKYYEYYENGHIKKEYFMIQNGSIIKQDSISKSYYDNGRLRIEETFKDGKLFNIIQLYNKDGISKSFGNFKDGTGIINIYSIEGKLIAEECYHNGKLMSRKNLKP